MGDRYVATTWEVWTYEVWGNAKEGYEVNDRYNVSREYPIRLTVHTNNAGTDREFDSAYPTDSQLRKALGLSRIKIHADGDDLHISVERASDGLPIGELICTSHESLSPIRKGSV